MEGENSTSGPQPYQPYEGGDYHLPYFQHNMAPRRSISCKSRLVAKHPKNSNKINGIFSDSSIPHEKLMRLSKLQSLR